MKKIIKKHISPYPQGIVIVIVIVIGFISYKTTTIIGIEPFLL